MNKRELAFAISILILNGMKTLACDCMPPAESVAESLKRYGAVFSGKVMEIRRPARFEGQVGVRFKVERSWKYVDQEEVIVMTNLGTPACGYPYREGERYLVWACVGWKDKNKLGSRLCDRTKYLEAAESDLKQLGDGKKVGGQQKKNPN